MEKTRQWLFWLDEYSLSSRLYAELLNAAQSLCSPRYLVGSGPNTPLNPVMSKGVINGASNYTTVFAHNYRLGYIEVLAESFKIS